MGLYKLAIILLLCAALNTVAAQKGPVVHVSTKKLTMPCNKATGIKLAELYKVKGGTPPYKYKWSTNIVNRFLPDPVLNLKGDASVYLTVTDAQGLSASGEFLFKLTGCKENITDTDMDGIIDTRDSCKKDGGLAKYNGCPDRDDDGIIDKYDECPDTPGKNEFNGCPDFDGDGIPDKNDLCPDLQGAKEHYGCPDSDGDGIFDNEDRCINDKGEKENLGCPLPDKDGDGVADKYDVCPKVAGSPENKGCPVLSEREEQIVKDAMDNLAFETGGNRLSENSYHTLYALVNLLFNRPKYGLRIEGHTDNIGTEENNLVLSQKRAEVVRQYLIEQGLKDSRLQAIGYGEAKPIADNNTEEGRRKNRRVELIITFK